MMIVRWLPFGCVLAVAGGFDFLALVTDHGSGSSALHRKLSRLDRRLLSVGELFSPSERLVAAAADNRTACGNALFDGAGAPRAPCAGAGEPKCVAAVATQLTKRYNASRAVVAAARADVRALLAEPLGSVYAFLARLRRVACAAAVGAGDCLLALKVFPVYVDNDLEKIADFLAHTSVAVLQLERLDEVARRFSNFRRFELPACARAAKLDGAAAAAPHDYAAYAAGNATAALAAACPCAPCARGAGKRLAYHAFLDQAARPRIPHRPWLSVAFEDLYARDDDTRRAADGRVDAFVADLLGRFH